MSYTFELGLKIRPGLLLDTEQYPDSRIYTPLAAITQQIGSDLEQACLSEDRIIAQSRPHLVGLAHTAFADHRHMILDPDTIWITIEKGLAIHITENAEELRSQFVNFEGKKTLNIRRDHFVRGGVNDWEGCFDEFSEKIGGEIGENKRDLIVSDFSTTTRLQKVSSEILLMDAMSKYFDYAVTTLCSIPLVTLEGTVEDWENIRDRTQALSEFGLSWWTDELLPTLDQLVLTAKGKPDLDFWGSWYKIGGGSGGPYISGHVNNFFPYLQRGETYSKNDFGHHNTMDNFVKGASQVPFVWDYYSTKYPMDFLGGIIGVSQDPTGALRSSFGWAVRDAAIPLTSYAWEKLSKDMLIHHQDGRVGKLKQAFAETYEEDRSSHSVTKVEIEWEGGDVEEVKRELRLALKGGKLPFDTRNFS